MSVGIAAGDLAAANVRVVRHSINADRAYEGKALALIDRALH